MTIRKFAQGILLATAVFLAPGVAKAQDTYAIDPVHSMMIFKIDHLGTSDFYGRVNDVTGTLVVGAEPSQSSIKLEAKVDNIDTNQDKRDEHLRGPDFFNAKQFPKMTFQSTSVTKTGEKAFEVAGNLTIKGVTKPVTLKVTGGNVITDPSGKTRIGFNTEFSVKRSDYGMNFMPDKLGDEVTLMVAVEGTK